MKVNQTALLIGLLVFLVLVVGIFFIQGADSTAPLAGGGDPAFIMMPVISLIIAGLLVLFGVVTFVQQVNDGKRKRQASDPGENFTVNDLDEVVLGGEYILLLGKVKIPHRRNTMKLTVKQLKGLIREAVEEAKVTGLAGPRDPDEVVLQHMVEELSDMLEARGLYANQYGVENIPWLGDQPGFSFDDHQGKPVCA